MSPAPLAVGMGLSTLKIKPAIESATSNVPPALSGKSKTFCGRIRLSLFPLCELIRRGLDL
jgi:hypothetical protein